MEDSILRGKTGDVLLPRYPVLSSSSRNNGAFDGPLISSPSGFGSLSSDGALCGWAFGRMFGESIEGGVRFAV